MTQISDVLPSVFGESGLAAIRARNSEIVVRCPEHGEFSRNDLLTVGMQEDACPECYRKAGEMLQQAQRIKAAVQFFRNTSGVPLRFQESSFEGYKPGNAKAQKILATLREYAGNFAQHRKLGLSLILCGGPGTGKTHLSCSVLHSLAHDHGITGKYCTAYRAVQEVRESYRSRDISELQAMEAFIQPDLLVLDEIGVQYGTDSEQLILFNILNGRYEALKPTIVISNLPIDEAAKYLGARVYDRLRENGGGVLAFDWESWRTKGVRP